MYGRTIKKTHCILQDFLEVIVSVYMLFTLKNWIYNWHRNRSFLTYGEYTKNRPP